MRKPRSKVNNTLQCENTEKSQEILFPAFYNENLLLFKTVDICNEDTPGRNPCSIAFAEPFLRWAAVPWWNASGTTPTWYFSSHVIANRAAAS
jgi:hypothetical protein